MRDVYSRYQRRVCGCNTQPEEHEELLWKLGPTFNVGWVCRWLSVTFDRSSFCSNTPSMAERIVGDAVEHVGYQNEKKPQSCPAYLGDENDWSYAMPIPSLQPLRLQGVRHMRLANLMMFEVYQRIPPKEGCRLFDWNWPIYAHWIDFCWAFYSSYWCIISLLSWYEYCWGFSPFPRLMNLKSQSNRWSTTGSTVCWILDFQNVVCKVNTCVQDSHHTFDTQRSSINRWTGSSYPEYSIRCDACLTWHSGWLPSRKWTSSSCLAILDSHQHHQQTPPGLYSFCRIFESILPDQRTGFRPLITVAVDLNLDNWRRWKDRTIESKQCWQVLWRMM